MSNPDDPHLIELRRRLVLAFARLEERFEADHAEWRRQRTRRDRRLVCAALVGLAVLGTATAVVRQRAPTNPPVARVAAPEPEPPAVLAAPVPAAPPDDVTALRGLLREWIAATNQRDFAGQMGFYPPRVSAFYLARDVSRDAVLAEKQRVFVRADVIDIRAAEPDIVVAADGRSAVMRFRKQYVIRGPRIDRAGEVLQELRWVRSVDGWRIDSERDIRVLRRDAGLAR